MTVPEISKENLAALKEVSVYAVRNKDEAREYIGFKHINGPHKWEALAKARFAADWYRSEPNITIEKIARRLGDGHDTVARLVNGMFVLDQARDEKIFELADRYPGRRFAFSHLYTALTRPEYRDFLGLGEEWRMDKPLRDPVPAKHLKELRLMLRWLYGSKSDDLKPVIASQNPDIENLAAVLGNPRARTMMITRNNLTEAYASVTPKSSRFESALINARQEAEVALSVITGYDPKDFTLLELGKDLAESGNQIYLTMQEMASRKPSAKTGKAARARNTR